MEILSEEIFPYAQLDIKNSNLVVKVQDIKVLANTLIIALGCYNANRRRVADIAFFDKHDKGYHMILDGTCYCGVSVLHKDPGGFYLNLIDYLREIINKDPDKINVLEIFNNYSITINGFTIVHNLRTRV